MIEAGGAKLCDIEPGDDGVGFALYDADDNTLALFVYLQLHYAVYVKSGDVNVCAKFEAFWPECE
jgi:hypothetical protein